MFFLHKPFSQTWKFLFSRYYKKISALYFYSMMITQVKVRIIRKQCSFLFEIKPVHHIELQMRFTSQYLDSNCFLFP